MNPLPAITNAAKGAFNYLEGGAENVAQDIGTGLGYVQTPGLQGSQNQTIQIAQQAESKANQTNDPAEKARLHQVAANAYATVSQGASQQASSYSPDVTKNPIERSLGAAADIATGADIAAHPIATVKAPFQLAKGLVKGAAKYGNMSLPDIVNTIKNGNAAQAPLPTITKPNKLVQTGNRVLASQFKNGDKVVRNPVQTMGELAKYGLTSPDSISQAAQTVTGSSSAPAGQAILNKAVENGVNSLKSIETGEVTDPQTGQTIRPDMITNAKNLLEKEGALTPQYEKKILGQVNKATLAATDINNIAGGAPKPWLNSLRNWESQLNDVTDIHGNIKQNLDASEQARGRVLKGLISDLRGRIFEDTGLNNTPLSNFLSPQDIQDLQNIHPQLATDAQNSSVLGGRGLQRAFVNGAKLAGSNASFDESLLTPESAIPGIAFATGHPVAAIASKLLGTQASKRAIGGTLRALGGATPTSGASANLALPAIKTGELAYQAAKAGNQNNSGNNPNQNFQSTPSPSSTGTSQPIVSQFDTNVNDPAKIPQSPDQLKPMDDGNYYPPDIFAWKDPSDPSGNTPMFISKGTYDQMVAAQANVVKSHAQAYLSKPWLKTQDDATSAQINALWDRSKDITQVGGPYDQIKQANTAFVKAENFTKQYGGNLANLNQTWDAFQKNNDPQYSDLKAQLKVLAKQGYDLSDVVVGAGLGAQLQTMQKATLMQLYSNVGTNRGFTGVGSTGVQSIPAANNVTQAPAPQHINIGAGGMYGGNPTLGSVPATPSNFSLPPIQ